MSRAGAVTAEQCLAPEWLQPIAAPLGTDGCGEDPRYSDHFGVIKVEIDKLKGNDYPLVEQLCLEVLVSQSKDLRVAGYLLLAKTYSKGMVGLLEALQIYLVLVTEFAEQLHPQKPVLRQRALEWLNNRKLETYVRQNLTAAETGQLTELRRLLDALNQALSTTYGDSAPCWTSLDAPLTSRLAQQTPAEIQDSSNVSPAKRPPRQESAAPAANFPQQAGLAAIASERDLLSATRTIREYLLGNQDLARAVAFSRALRWGALQLPPHEGGKTRIPAPRQTALNELQQLAGAGSPDALLSLCESLFLEPGGHLFLDLQRYACEAAEKMGRGELAELIAEQCLGLIRRLPELPGLKFEDDSPFADVATRSWLEEHSRPDVSRSENRDEFAGQLETLLASGRQLLRQKQLSAALDLLKGCSAKDGRQRLQLELAKARLCLEAGKAEIALPLSESLAAQIESQPLVLWAPELAIDIWRLQLEASQASLKKSTAEEKAGLKATIARLKGQICCAAPELAARLF